MIQPGDYFTRLWHGITIYGYAMTLDEIRNQEEALGASEEELDWTMEHMEHRYRMGVVYGDCYSEVVVKGEFGSTPVRAAIKISKEEFERARANDWSP